MSATFAHLHPTTRAQRRMVAAVLLLAVCGGILCLMVATHMGEVKTLHRPLTRMDAWFCLAGTVGGLAGLWYGRHWLGHGGVGGAMRAVGGGAIVSFVGALVAGTLALPLYGTMFGPLMFVLTLWGQPVLAVVWVAALTLAHRLMRERRQQRVTPFTTAAHGIPTLAPLRQGNWLVPR